MSKEAGAGTNLGGVEDGFVAFLAAGEPAVGDFRCSDCGYGVSVCRALPVCPMCGSLSWLEAPIRFVQAAVVD